MPANDGHLSFAASFVSKAQSSGKSVAVLLLQYDLAPGRRYPRQLQQAVELLRYTTTVLKKAPQQIMLAGDSAGGNMALGVLSHLMSPHPSIDSLKLSGPLAGALISSPVTVLNTRNPGFRTREAQDPAAADTIRTWLKNLLGPNSPDAWNQPLTNDASWWSGLSSVVKEVLMTVASVEMMAEDTIALATKIKVSVLQYGQDVGSSMARLLTQVSRCLHRKLISMHSLALGLLLDWNWEKLRKSWHHGQCKDSIPNAPFIGRPPFNSCRNLVCGVQ